MASRSYALETILILLRLSLFLKLHHKTTLAEDSNVHIIYMGEKHHEDPTVVEEFHHDMLSTLLGSKDAAQESILYSYKHAFSGFAAKLSKCQAEAIKDFPGIVHVMPNRVHKLHTTNSWDFIGLHSHSRKNLLTEARMGEDVIIGVIDTGIWPESESFKDEGMTPVPSRWKGTCQQGEEFNYTNCNKKLIGARWFLKGAEAETKRSINSIKKEEYISARDIIGHGTHTASIVAGFPVRKASYKGLATGTARGGAPHARIAAYKACWAVITDQGCTDADVLKAFDEAVNDGVDVISVSLGSHIPLFGYIEDSITMASFHAVAKGITVICSAGNDGPFSQTVSNAAPWIITVAASTISRAFPTAITLGNNLTLMGQSMNMPRRRYKNRFHGLEYSEWIAGNEIAGDSGGNSCHEGMLNATLAKGKIILCFSMNKEDYIEDAATSASEAGAIGLIFAQTQDSTLYPCDEIPCIKVTYEVGTQILTYIRRTKLPIVKLGHPKTVNGKWVSPRIAYFSSRGPSSFSPSVLKPDIAAPGVNILAARSDPKDSEDRFIFLSGTSMACPHVSGVAALIKSVHQDWSPAAIRSALITTASQTGTDGGPIMNEDGTRKQADPFDLGGGHLDPTRAAHPGLVYNMSTEDYIPFLCSMGYKTSAISNLSMKHETHCRKTSSALDLNLPSIVIPDLKRSVTISRVVTNVGPVNSVYKAHVNPPYGIKVKVIPSTLSFNSTTKSIKFKVTFSSNTKVHKDYSFGSLTWTDGVHNVRSPIAVRVILFDSYADM